jgi:hypothetical protein
VVNLQVRNLKAVDGVNANLTKGPSAAAKGLIQIPGGHMISICNCES